MACLSVDEVNGALTLNGLLRCIFRVLRVSSFNGLYSAPRPFLLTLTTVNVDKVLLVNNYRAQKRLSQTKRCLTHAEGSSFY